METKHTKGQASLSVYEKLRRKMSIASPFRRTRKNASYQEPESVTTPTKAFNAQATRAVNSQVQQPWSAKVPEGRFDAKRAGHRRSGSDMNARFSAYIDNAWGKFSKTVSNVGNSSKKDVGRVDVKEKRNDVVDDKAAEYIKRARMKIRTTSSSLGMGKNMLSKNKGN